MEKKVLQKRQSMTINRNDTSTFISTQLDSLIPASKISTLSQGMFVGAVSDNFDERIEQKMFHAEIVVDHEKVLAETKNYQRIPEILSFVDENGKDRFTSIIEENYRNVEQEVMRVIENEIERIKAHPELAPGRIFTLQNQFHNCLRLNYGGEWNRDIEKALVKLGQLANQMI